MWGLLASTIVTSAIDSINPIGIVQQFVLQGLVKKPQHIWYFIVPTGITNLIVGLLVYYGFVTYVKTYFSQLMVQYGRVLYVVELLLGVVCLTVVGYLVWHTCSATCARRQLTGAETQQDDVEFVSQKVYSVAPLALVGIGVASTLAELTNALPYFAFLAILFNYRLSLLQLLAIMVLYNLIYMSPFMILYFIYIKAQDKFDTLYELIRTQMTKWKTIVTKFFVGGVGLFLVLHSTSRLLA